MVSCCVDESRDARDAASANATPATIGDVASQGESATAKPSSATVKLSENEWRERLDEMSYHVLREKGTERAFTGAYWDHHEEGVYRCKGCGAELFVSDSKFDSGCGWPSFDAPAAKDTITQQADLSFGWNRTEVLCKRCGGHLGHVFDDGPTQTGLRYCINSASLDFVKKGAASPSDSNGIKTEPATGR
ncbi:MAG: peptide-methionine (R)-S-oxide reductase MsrB [Planctomycetes bacterium]|nr:peptide-methionine (R)-S-oxide reductase MsrB [Planctomycetota bacterium]MCB9918760.1 peptide-methionine (R)-S-oxide reductase MsrB [Planctomycetota bacterium]